MRQGITQKPEDLLNLLGVNPEFGLPTQEAADRLTKYGPNKLVEERETRFIAILREEITEPMILLLLTIGVLYGLVNQDIKDALTIVSITAILVFAEVWNEYRAKKSINALKKLAAPTTSVLRNGQPINVQTSELVPGDILLLRQGERVPADARLLKAVGLEADESALTGESFPTTKNALTTTPSETRISEQNKMVFAGTIITKGHAKAVVTATGLQTELGRVTGITKAAREPKTPLQTAMKQLSKTLIWIAVFFSILIPSLAFLRGLEPTQAILYGLSLSFATIPEEMPIIITMVLGIGAYSLSRKKAIVRRLRAAETLGSTTVIATDKTGTITEGKMSVESLYYDFKLKQKRDFGPNEREALKTALLASDPAIALNANSVFSNPMSLAILEGVKDNNTNMVPFDQRWILEEELQFDNNRKGASYIYKMDNKQILLSSGAPENLLENSSKTLVAGQETELTHEMRATITNAITDMAQKGQRLLAFGYRRLGSAKQPDNEIVERDLVFLGTIGFIDPPRREVREAIRSCQEAGVKVIMITGDHPETAKAIASEVGIPASKVVLGEEIARLNDRELKTQLKSTFIYARTSPEDKLRLVRLLKDCGEIVAVTGDGINDAPALREAHIGIAMGIRGTDVAKESADIVLSDDNFATLTTAIKEGRKIFSNLRKGVRYYLACKIALVASFIVPIILGLPLPFAPIQIIVLELFMDLAASATFVAEPEERGTMKKPPLLPTEKFINKTMLETMALGALSLFVAVTGCYLYAWYSTGGNIAVAQTVAFATWMVGHIFLAFNLRSEKQPLMKLGLRSNKLMVLWALVVAGTLAASIGTPYLHESLRITGLDPLQWVIILGVAFAATFWMELKKLLRR